MSEFENLKINAEIHADPYNNKEIGNIYLCVDWEGKDASLIEMDGNGIPADIYHHKWSVYQLPGSVDTEYFKKSVYPRIIPLLEKMSEKYETVWNGSNYVGNFDMDMFEQVEVEGDIQEMCQRAPEIDGEIVFDMSDCCENTIVDIPEFFKDSGFNFIEVDIDNMNIEEIKEILAGEGSVWLCDHESIKEELKEIQEELKEIQEELKEDE